VCRTVLGTGHCTGNRGDRATGLAPCASNAAVLYFSRRRPRGLSASGFFILVALPVPGKVYFYRAEIQVGSDLDRPDLLAVDGKFAPKSLPHAPSGGSVYQ
jgi:hypothetical protein